MKSCKQFLIALLALGLLLGISVSAAEKEGELVSLLMGEDLQQFAETSLPAEAGIGGEWYALYLAQRDEEYDLSEYAAALAAYFSTEHRLNPVERQRCALAWLAAGGSAETAAEIAEDTVGAQGSMSRIFGLHLMHNGVAFPGHTVKELADSLVALQLADGGWALSGEYADVDVTAMTLQALAPLQEDYTEVIEQGIACLASKQQPDGGFKSYGVSNPESVAQVVIAMTALGIDPRTDGRFSGDMTAVWAQFRTEDGGYSHTVGGNRNGNACTQVLLALRALDRFDSGKGSLYLLELSAEELPEISFPEDSSKEESIPETPSAEESLDASSGESSAEAEGMSSPRMIVLVLSVLMGVLSLVYLLIPKKK